MSVAFHIKVTPSIWKKQFVFLSLKEKLGVTRKMKFMKLEKMFFISFKSSFLSRENQSLEW